VHFNLGLAYLHKQDYDRARAEFHKDIVLDPNESFSYEQLGGLEATAGNDDEAARNYHAALDRDPRLINAHMGLAKIEERRHNYPAALAELDRVLALDEGDASAMYLRGQVLVRMGRDKEGREQLARATKILNEQREARHRQLEGETVPSPELTREPE
jgi:tetratricopeptide (TPR) repeat protein